MAAILTADLDTRICEAFGLDPEPVTALTVEFRAGQVVNGTVEFMAKIEGVNEFIECIKHYELVERQPEEGAS